MSSSTSTSSAKPNREKVFTFKKREVVPTVEMPFEDDDDDDFKPSRHRHTKSQLVSTKSDDNYMTTEMKKVAEKMKENQATRKTGKKTVSNLNTKKDNNSAAKSSCTTGTTTTTANAVLQENDCETDDDNSGELANLRSVTPELQTNNNEKVVETDDIEFVCAIASTTPPKANNFSGSIGKDDGKEAWKKLMSKMQTSQTSSKISKKGSTSAAKRGLVKKSNAVAVSGNKLSPTQSPLKKSPRLGDADVPSLRTMDESISGTAGVSKVCFPSTSQELRASQTDATTKTSFDSTLESVKENSIKVAPIFLPPSERKALQKTTSMKSESSEILQSIINSASDVEYDNLPDDPAHFSGNKVILNQYLSDKDPYEGNKTKVCPFYKKLPGVPFCVDAFNYGLIPGMEVYFLSHFHSDHYIGLTKKFCKTIICSHPTGNLVRMKLYVEEKCIRRLHLDKPYLIYDSEVTLVDANHCPGSVMFIYRFKNGTVTLHTGDFRYTPDMLQNDFISGLSVDNLYLDTTYCSPQYDFPTQNESIASMISHIKRHLEFRPETLILCGSYLIGKERVYFTLAEAIGSKVFGTYDKRKILNALGNKRFSSLLCAEEDSAQVHVVPMFSITAKSLQEYLAKHPRYTNIIGIKPSGWQFSSCASGCSVKSHYNNSVTVLGVPYSEHSSFSELKEFVTSLKPKKEQPTVNVGNPKKRGEMMQYIQTWLSS